MDVSNFFNPLGVSLILFIFLTFISLPVLNYFSDLLTSIGIYHRNESFHIRVALLFKAYVILSVPIIFSIIMILLNTRFVTNLFDAIIIAMGSFVIFPITVRVLSLAKRPRPYICSRVKWNLLKESLSESEVKNHQKLIFCERKERYISTVFSFIIASWILYVIILPVYVYINGTDVLNPILQTPTPSFQNSVILFFIFLGLPLIYAAIGEVCLKITGVEELLILD